MKAPLERCLIVGSACLALAASAKADGWGQGDWRGGYYAGPPAAYQHTQWGQPGPTVQPLPGPVVRPLPGPVIGPSLHGQRDTVIIYRDAHGRERPYVQGRPLREHRSSGPQPFAEDHSYRSQRFSFDRAYGNQPPVISDRPFHRQSQPRYYYDERGVAVPVAPIVHPNAPVWVPNSAAPIYYGD